MPDGLTTPWDAEAQGDATWIAEKAGTIGRHQDGDFARAPRSRSSIIAAAG